MTLEVPLKTPYSPYNSENYAHARVPDRSGSGACHV